MLNNLLAIVPGTGDKAGNWYFDNVGEAFIYALIGFAVVFAGIVIIIGIIWLVGFIMQKTNNLEFLTKKKAKAPKEVVNQVESSSQEATSDEIPDEVKVAIVAALMAYYEQQQDKCQFTVKRIKRI
jgi:Na+-transporting methylmalonyl-CoA/oxaloacetate decarboxylase gamma subunit